MKTSSGALADRELPFSKGFLLLPASQVFSQVLPNETCFTDEDPEGQKPFTTVPTVTRSVSRGYNVNWGSLLLESGFKHEQWLPG